VTKANQDRNKINHLLSLGVVVLEDPTAGPHIDLPWLMQTLLTRGIATLMVEGGGTIHESFIRHQFFDRIYAQVSPILIGGADAKTPVEGLGFATLKEASRVAFSNHFKTDRDIILVAERNPEETI
ncbi:MAG: RibD family protein, partial [Bacilli bacterium]